MKKDCSAQSAQLKKALGLYKPANRERYGRQLVEGVQAVRELLVCAPELVCDVFMSASMLEKSDLVQILNDLPVYVHIATEETLLRAVPSSQGVFAVARMHPERSCEDIYAHTSLLVCCVQANDPGNVGTIIRTADAAGAGAVLLGKGSVHADSPKVIRSAAGSTFHIPVLSGSAEEYVRRAHEAGFQILLADAHGEADISDALKKSAQRAEDPGIDLDLGIDLGKKTMWLVGNEAHGFTAQQRAWADITVNIPMWGQAESLNLSVATSLCVYASAYAQHWRS